MDYGNVSSNTIVYVLEYMRDELKRGGGLPWLLDQALLLKASCSVAYN
jgi:hypothetical protein